MNIFIANHVLLLSCILAIVGWVVSFVGLCVSATTGPFTHVISWWITTFELTLVLLVSAVIWINAIDVYRPVILTMIAISVPYATQEIAHYIITSQPALFAASAGYIVLLVAQFSWLFLFGIQHQSLVFQSPHHLSYSYHTNQSNLTMPYGMGGNNSQLDITKPYSTVGATTIPSSVPTPLPTSTITQQQYNASESTTDNTVFVSPHTEYTIPVIALHTYEANPEDPNELKFTKGETLYVHEQKGNWWQARKANGSAAGIIPANYVTPILH
ncbi:hypothetical protein BDA99DRAFT_569146 [Phascolomyces articulosus]|uniref:SH3 domain-containing protein n=1 Tax=Phascolomyces articulosus TaxID=60185 RepID=A0AAD5KJI8_9FUNG|nr:hypothetical protein BDA99DRAFT_569146 [Phascolomyces articulosus]